VNSLDNLDQIAAWLHGDGNLIIGDLPTRSFQARVNNQMDWTKVVRSMDIREFNVVFRCKPYRYVYPAPDALPYLSMTNRVTNGISPAERRVVLCQRGPSPLKVGASNHRDRERRAPASKHHRNFGHTYISPPTCGYNPDRIRLRGIAGTSTYGCTQPRQIPSGFPGT
jgi:hypothetical protein